MQRIVRYGTADSVEREVSFLTYDYGCNASGQVLFDLIGTYGYMQKFVSLVHY